MKFLLEPLQTITLSNLCEMFDNLYSPDAETFLRPSLMMSIAEDTLDITVDGMHCGTLVGLQWFLEQMTHDNVAWVAHENDDFDKDKWVEVWNQIHDGYLKVEKMQRFAYLILTD